jgi:hypothetical protein
MRLPWQHNCNAGVLFLYPLSNDFESFFLNIAPVQNPSLEFRDESLTIYFVPILYNGHLSDSNVIMLGMLLIVEKCCNLF